VSKQGCVVAFGLGWAVVNAGVAFAQAPPAEPPSPPPQGAASAGRAFNPDISLIGNVLAVAGRTGVTPEPSFQLTEAELAFQSIVDPYARADFFVAVGPEGAEVEEAFITFTALPGNLLLKAGKFRAQFGKVSTLHTHRLPSADRPLVATNLLGGEEGLADSGLSLSHLIANPLLFLELTGEVYAGASEVFESPERSRLAYLGRVRAYRDLTEAINLDLGSSVAFGPTLAEAGDGGEGEGEAVDSDSVPELNRRLVGVDVTLRYRPLQRAIYRRFNVRSELVWSRQDTPAGEAVTAFGAYALAEYQFARRWYLGGRIDRAARPFDGTQVDRGGSVFLTFWATEFSQIRGQMRRTHLAEGIAATEALLQFNFSIGAHGAHEF
jgi:hypothetical protein